jgi:ribosomal protein S18 acetylase RimI-like enzyme
MSLITQSVQAFLYTKRQQGTRAALGAALQFARLPFFEFHRGYALRRSLQEPIDVQVPEVVDSIRQIGLADLALLETIMPPLRVNRVASKLRAGEVCCGAIKDNNMVAYVLAGFARTPSTLDTRLELGPKEAYLWAGYALPQYRRQGVVKAVNLSLCCVLREKGYESVVLLVDRCNEASLGHCRKMGYRVVDQFTHLRLLGWRMGSHDPVEEAEGA